jgi:hypothetical protein
VDIDQGRGERLIDHLSTILQVDIGAAALVIEIDFNVRVRAHGCRPVPSVHVGDLAARRRTSRWQGGIDQDS